jgi:uncharacterized heparinase superfamily protein
MTSLGRYWRTVRHLRPVQIYGRIWFKLHTPRIDRSPAPSLRPPGGRFTAPARRAACMTGPDEFRLLNRVGRLAGPDPWNDDSYDKLWLYNLHYFDDLNAVDAPARADWHRSLIVRWIAENVPGSGNGWEPYPTSLRIVNWIAWALAGNRLEPEWLDSLAIQARWLARRIEWHLLGNHLFATAKALIFAGAFFDGPEAEQWREAGLAILKKQIPEQVLPDGGHFERSPMYHAIILTDLLDLLNLAAVYPDLLPASATTEWRDAVQRMRRWLAVMCHPDREIAFFNDAAFGIAAAPADIEAYVGRLGLPSVARDTSRAIHLADSSYIRLSWGDCVVLINAGSVAPSYLPGHAHAGTLSFELSIGQERVIVNSGTSQYDSGPGRQDERGTAAHSTVEVDGENSSEVWDGFRVGRRARVHDLIIRQFDDTITVSCWHDGYRWLAGKPIHRREWILRDGILQVKDHVIGAATCRPVVYYHLAPGIKGTDTSDKACESGELTTSSGARIGWRSSLPMAARTTQRHLQFGLSEPAKTLSAVFPGQTIETQWRWQGTAG